MEISNDLPINIFACLGSKIVEVLTADERKAINSISERLSSDPELVKRFSRGYVNDCLSRYEEEQRASKKYQEQLKATLK
jgi:hypothetical protein